MEIFPADWQTLGSLAEGVGLSPERVPALRRRMETTPSGSGRPYFLIAGQIGGGIERLLAHWIGEEAAEALEAASDRPLVIGPAPDKVQPAVGAWPVWKRTSRGEGAGHLIVVRAAGARLAADVAVGLGTLGFLDGLVLVTRLGQPVNQTEREFARVFAPLAATARALIVGLPGEAPSASDMAKVAAYAANHLRQAGFGEGRCLGAGVWFAEEDGAVARPGAVGDVSEWLVVKPTEVENGRAGMFHQAIGALLGEISRRVIDSPTPPQVPIDEAERERLARELEEHLAALGREAARWVQTRPATSLSDEALKTHCLDALKGWGAYSGPEGTWLRYVERLRPGTQTALIAEGARAMETLGWEMPASMREERAPSETAPTVRSGAGEPAWLERAVLEAKRLGAAVLAGLGAYWLVGSLPGAGGFSVAPLLLTLLRYVAFALVGVLAYEGARRIFPAGRPVGRPVSSRPADASRPTAALSGWTLVERRLVAWFRGQLEARPLAPTEAVGVLARRLGLEDSVSGEPARRSSPL